MIDNSFSFVEENYIKAVYHLNTPESKPVSTNALADEMQTTAASVSDMLKKLSQKKVVFYQKYKGVSISPKGKEIALKVIRKHRLWEVFLVDKLKFNWDEVHEVAEQLEHIKSPLLISRLDEFLGYPKYDPHGDPIPDDKGNFAQVKKEPLSEVAVGAFCQVIAVDDSSTAFLKYLDKMGISIGTKLSVEDKNEFDGSIDINLENDKSITVSPRAAENLLVATE